MIYTPRYIIFKAVLRYLDQPAKERLSNALGKSEKITDASFIKIMEQHFDFTRMRDNPLIPEDAKHQKKIQRPIQHNIREPV